MSQPSSVQAGGVGAGPVAPREDAVALGEYLLSAGDLHDAILRETAESAERGRLRESGRTVCQSSAGYRARRPLARYDRAVTLAACRRGETGIMHTHVTQQELASPEHSLPDMANVIFGGIAASVVVGTEQSQLLVAPDDPAAAAREFREALGLDVDSTRDVVRALEDGQVPNPPAARARVTAALPLLFERRPTPNHDLRDRLRSEVIPLAASREASAVPAHAETPAGGDHGRPASALGLSALAETTDGERDVAAMRRQSREVAATLDGLLAGVDVQQAAVSSVVSAIAGQLAQEFLLP